jgi:fumarate reductase subunit C
MSARLLTQGEKGVLGYLSFAAMVRVVLRVAAWAVALLASMGWFSSAHHTALQLSSGKPLQRA